MVLAYGTKKNNFFHPQLLTITLLIFKEVKEYNIFYKNLITERFSGKKYSKM
jgi:hypothetical protein